MTIPHRATWYRILTFVAVLLVAASARAVAATPLRVCADPAYLPFSNRAGDGFENKIAQYVARAMGRPLQYTWMSTRGEGGFDQFVQNTLAAGKCDLVVDVPYADSMLLTTKPYYISSYVFIYKKDKGYDLTSMDSPVLHRLKIGYEADTPAANGLKIRALTPGAVPFLVAENDGESPGVIIKAVEDGKISVGITWDPAIGYFVKQHPDLAVVDVPNSRTYGAPEQYTFPMSMAVRQNDKSLQSALNRIIAAHLGALDAILAQYGIHYLRPQDSN